MIALNTSVGCGDTKTAVTPQVYRILEEALVQKTKAERDLKTYTNLVTLYYFNIFIFMVHFHMDVL